MKGFTVGELRPEKFPHSHSRGIKVRLTTVTHIGVLALTLLALIPAAAVAAKPVPKGFIGVMVDGPALDSKRFDRELKLMAGSGVESVRIAIRWYEAQPYGSSEPLLTDPNRDRFELFEGVPTDYTEIDRLVAGLAKYGLTVMPTVFGTPPWAAEKVLQRGSVPANPQSYANFMAALARRYGPGGSFWQLRPELKARPITQWQIWNEPSLTQYWVKQPFATSYVALLKAARQSIKAVNPKAKIILAGLPNTSWHALETIYRQPGAKDLFDIASVHPFSAKSVGVVRIIDLFRAVMDNYGDDSKALTVSELSWPSSKGKSDTEYGFETNEKGQAKKVKESLPLLSRKRGEFKIQSIYWYNWLSPKSGSPEPFDYGGLRKLISTSGKTVSKPAFKVFKQTALKLEGCGSKPPKTARCKAKAGGKALAG